MALLHYHPPMTPYLRILYRDEYLLVLEKPSGLLSVPGIKFKDSMQTRAQRVFPTATVVHRLDMATSGIMLMPLQKQTHRVLSSYFQQRLIKKRYLARVHGVPQEDSGEINLPLIVDWENKPKQKIDYEHGKPSQTFWKTLGHKDNESLIELNPITGRSHQLRVHMLSMGHPILGDRLYAHPEALAMTDRLQLHATEISFEHPDTQQPMHFKSHCPFAEDY
ncbi:RNA pseudouridine synthase [Alteromonadaceae bacterium M269]|nr:RNA pseudouridine synthase [Alteromonadaceae bacterium M269]